MSRPPRRVSPATLFFALLSLALGVALYLETRPPERAAPSPPASRAPARPRPRPRSTTRPPSNALRSRPALPGSSEPRIAIVIDDLGSDPAAVERIAGWRYPVAGAVLPELPGSAAAARRLGRSGKEVLLHLPMEPKGFPQVRPGPGVVLRSQPDEEIVRTLLADLDTVPGAIGVNNHMGSAATADARVMRAVLGALAPRNLFFLDSRTTDATVARAVAGELSLPVASRRVFLDGLATDEGIERQFSELVRRAREEGSAVAIGHPHARTLAVLERELPRLAGRGVRLVKVSELVDRDVERQASSVKR